VRSDGKVRIRERASGGLAGAVEEARLQSHQPTSRRQAPPIRCRFQLHRFPLLQRLRHRRRQSGPLIFLPSFFRENEKITRKYNSCKPVRLLLTNTVQVFVD
jgi:hypothetical protein